MVTMLFSYIAFKNQEQSYPECRKPMVTKLCVDYRSKFSVYPFTTTYLLRQSFQSHYLMGTRTCRNGTMEIMYLCFDSFNSRLDNGGESLRYVSLSHMQKHFNEENEWDFRPMKGWYGYTCTKTQ